MKRNSRARIFTLTFASLIVCLSQLLPNSFSLLNKPSTPVTGSEAIPARTMANVTEKAASSDAKSQPAARRVQLAQSVAGREEPFTGSLASAKAGSLSAWQAGDELRNFRDSVRDGKADLVRGVYVAGVLSAPVVQQPQDDPAFVSTREDAITQFRSAAQNGVTGLLAHNFLLGMLYYKMALGQEVDLVFGDGRIARYLVSGIYQYQKVSPDNLRSDLINLSTGKRETTNQVFSRFYAGKEHITFQTCLERDGNSTWGLTFVVANPISE